MSDEQRKILIPRLEGYHCFACGTENPIGLKMSFYCLGRTVRSDLTLSEKHVGWENIVHGGVISTVLDEIMGWAVIAFKREFFVTRKIEVRYLRPVTVHAPVTAVAEIDPDLFERGCRTTATLQTAEGVPLATARAEVVFLPEKRIKALPADYVRDMNALFEKIKVLTDNKN
jgi:acyl-coenzyme A thioesterase PaaI-like protein